MTGEAWTPERIARYRLARSPGIGPVSFLQILEKYGTACDFFERGPYDSGFSSLRPRLLSPAETEREISELAERRCKILLYGDPLYPQRLAHIPDPPPLLYASGRTALLEKDALAIVGSRTPSAAGGNLAHQLALELAEQDFAILSGLARGIDSSAHLGALEAADGRGGAIAVIAGGLNRPYPPENIRLHNRIAEEGLLLTEAPFNAAPLARLFPRRNRIVAGLSLGCVILEARERSGTLITARLAAEYGREVFVVPGSPMDPRSRGGNALIRSGAVLIQNVADILEDLRRPNAAPAPSPDRQPTGREAKNLPAPTLFPEPADPQQKNPAPATRQAKEDSFLLSLLSPVPVSVESLIQRSGLPCGELMLALSELELEEKVEFIPPGMVAKIN